MALPIININETDKLSKAIENGLPFYIAGQSKKLLVCDPELKAVENELIAALEEAERCTTHVSLKEHKARIEAIIRD